MKTINKYILALAAMAGVVGGFSSCQDDFDDRKPGFEIPQATLTPNTTILDFKKDFWKSELNYCDLVGEKPDGSHYIIAGRVVSSDQAGNVYKKIVIEDETAALAMSINANSLYNDYRVGQEIVIDVTGMYMGKYCGCQQLGWPDVYEKTGVDQTSFMGLQFFKEHAQLNGLPEPAKIDTIVIRKFSDIPVDPSELPAYQSLLVRFNNVHFLTGGQEALTDGYKITTSRKLVDADNQQLTVRTSGYATFREEMLPEGNGDVVALLDYYRTSDDSTDSPWQLTIIDAQGLMNFGNPTVLPGSEDNPYYVEQVIDLERQGKSDRAWMTGYIVGAVAPEVTTVDSDDDIEFGAEVVLANTLVIAQDPDCKDWRECIVVSLPQDSPLRQVGNLRDNPGNYQKQIWLFGSFETYMGTWGLTGNSGATSQFRIDGVEAPGAGFPDGNGTEASPYNASQVIALNPTSTTASPEGGSQIWVRGYIVGYMPSTDTYLSNTVFGIPTDVQTNIVVGPTADCTDYNQCISIQLPKGTLRDALNLQSHPENLGREVALFGDVMKYCGGPGLKNTSKYTLGEGGGDTPNPPTPPAGDGQGTKDSPFVVSQVIALNPTSTTASPEGGSGVWVEGYIVGTLPAGQTTSINNTVFGTENANASNMILGPSADCTDPSQCITVQLVAGSDVRNAVNLKDHPENLGRQVKLFGDVMKYCGAPGLKNTSEYVLGEGGGDTPNPPAGDTTTIFSGLSTSLTDMPADWTIDNVSLDGVTSVWSWKVFNNAGYLNASAYVGGTPHASESYAISPVIDLTGVTGASVSFEHAAKFQTTLKTLCGIYAREAGSTTWTKLDITTWPGTDSWTFVNSGDIDLSAFNGKKIQIAFKYGSSASGADTWEIKNLTVKGKK